MPGAIEKRQTAWRAAAQAGHEIGNHSLMHACTGNFAWSRQKALEDYTLARLDAELEQAGVEIKRITGVLPTTFAYPCGQTFVGRGPDDHELRPADQPSGSSSAACGWARSPTIRHSSI